MPGRVLREYERPNLLLAGPTHEPPTKARSGAGAQTSVQFAEQRPRRGRLRTVVIRCGSASALPHGTTGPVRSPAGRHRRLGRVLSASRGGRGVRERPLGRLESVDLVLQRGDALVDALGGVRGLSSGRRLASGDVEGPMATLIAVRVRADGRPVDRTNRSSGEQTSPMHPSLTRCRRGRTRPPAKPRAAERHPIEGRGRRCSERSDCPPRSSRAGWLRPQRRRSARPACPGAMSNALSRGDDRGTRDGTSGDVGCALLRLRTKQ